MSAAALASAGPSTTHNPPLIGDCAMAGTMSAAGANGAMDEHASATMMARKGDMLKANTIEHSRSAKTIFRNPPIPAPVTP
jgi:hypothetical protein